MTVIQHHNNHVIRFFDDIVGDDARRISIDGLTNKGYVRFILDSFGNRIWDEYKLEEFQSINSQAHAKMRAQFRKEFVPWKGDEYAQYHMARLKDIGSRK